MTMIILNLPFPPSVNHYWGHRAAGKRVMKFLDARGKAYRKTIMEECLVQRLGPALQGPLSCTLDLYPPDNRRRDCDNYTKALLDALDHANVYGDDSQIRKLTITMHGKVPEGLCTISLEPFGGQQSEHNQIDLMAVEA